MFPEKAVRPEAGLLDLGLRDLAGRLRARRVSPVDVIDELARRIERLPPELNPFLTLDLDLARDRARALESADPDRVGLLHGVPMSIKDNVSTKDLRVTRGMAALKPVVDGQDDSFVAAARACGAIIYAKTNMPPNAYSDVTDNLIVGPTGNPHDIARTPGGSSGGAAAVVGAGLNPLAHGTDAGGSVRMPAAHCGVVGFKPSYGRLPRIPAPDLWNARGHHGLLARRVDDILYGMDALVGADPRDPLSLERADWDMPRQRASRGRVAVARSLFGQEVDSAVGAAFDDAIDRLRDAGVPVVEIDQTWPDPVDGMAGQMAALEHHLYGDLLRTTPERFDPGHSAYIRRGAEFTMTEHLTAQRERVALYSLATELMELYDAILTPSLPVVSWRLDEVRPTINGRPVRRDPGSRWPDMLLANLLGWPAISIPAGWVGHLPVGLQIIAPWRSDRACLAFAAEVEKILDVPTSAPPN